MCTGVGLLLSVAYEANVNPRVYIHVRISIRAVDHKGLHIAHRKIKQLLNFPREWFSDHLHALAIDIFDYYYHTGTWETCNKDKAGRKFQRPDTGCKWRPTKRRTLRFSPSFNYSSVYTFSDICQVFKSGPSNWNQFSNDKIANVNNIRSSFCRKICGIWKKSERSN